MINKMLISRKWVTPAIILLIIGALIGLLNFYGNWELAWLDIPHGESDLFDFNDYNLTNEIGLSFALIGLIALCFAKTRKEDEFVYQNPLLSWQWSVLINYSILFIANWVFYGTAFLSVMLFSMFSIPVIFLLRFHIVLYRLRGYEE